MSYDEIRDVCKEAWTHEEYIYLWIDRYKKKCCGKNCFMILESPRVYIDCLSETNLLCAYEWDVFFSIRIDEELKDLKKSEVQSQVKNLRLHEKIGIQIFD